MTDKAEKMLKGFRRMMLWNDPEKFQDTLGLSEAQSLTMANANLCFGAVIGSWNYGLQHENSDVDLKLAYWPTFQQFFDSSLPDVRVVTPELDFTLVPVHKLFLSLLKGNLGFYEMLFPLKEGYRWNYVDLVDETTHDPLGALLEQAKGLVHGNALAVYSANRGSAKQAIARAEANKNNCWAKESAKAYRFLNTAYVYLNEGRLTGFRDATALQQSIMAGNLPKEKFDQMYGALEKDTANLAEKVLPKLDHFNTPGYQRDVANYKRDLMNIVREHMRDM